MHPFFLFCFLATYLACTILLSWTCRLDSYGNNYTNPSFFFSDCIEYSNHRHVIRQKLFAMAEYLFPNDCVHSAHIACMLFSLFREILTYLGRECGLLHWVGEGHYVQENWQHYPYVRGCLEALDPLPLLRRHTWVHRRWCRQFFRPAPVASSLHPSILWTELYNLR